LWASPRFRIAAITTAQKKSDVPVVSGQSALDFSIVQIRLRALSYRSAEEGWSQALAASRLPVASTEKFDWFLRKATLQDIAVLQGIL
jgi:hypothetical protein